MRRSVIILLMAAASLSACKKMVGWGEHGHGSGRYAGIGLYSAGDLWRKLAIKEPDDKQAAKLEDDDIVVVVVDSQTGEIRQCGNMSGYCLRSNPWSKPAGPVPAKLTIHASELKAQEEVENTQVAVEMTNEAMSDAKPSARKK